MIAMIAALAMVRPKVGPMDFESKDRTPYLLCKAVWTAVTFVCGSCLAEIWNAYGPSALLFETCCTSGLLAPFELITERTWATVAGRWRLAVMRVPDVKSIPKLRPLPPTARAPTSRITPDSVKKYREAPIKSKRQLKRRLPAPSAEGRAIRRERPMV